MNILSMIGDIFNVDEAIWVSGSWLRRGNEVKNILRSHGIEVCATFGWHDFKSFSFRVPRHCGDTARQILSANNFEVQR